MRRWVIGMVLDSSSKCVSKRLTSAARCLFLSRDNGIKADPLTLFVNIYQPRLLLWYTKERYRRYVGIYRNVNSKYYRFLLIEVLIDNTLDMVQFSEILLFEANASKESTTNVVVLY